MSAVLTDSFTPAFANRNRPWGVWLLAGAVLAFLLEFLLWAMGLVI